MILAGPDLETRDHRKEVALRRRNTESNQAQVIRYSRNAVIILAVVVLAAAARSRGETADTERSKTLDVRAGSGGQAETASNDTETTFGKYVAFRVAPETLHPFQDQLSITATIVPWRGSGREDILVGCVHPRFFGTRIAIHYGVGRHGSQVVCDSGHTLSGLVGLYFQGIERGNGMFDLACRGDGTRWGANHLVHYRNAGSPGTPAFNPPLPLYVDGKSLRDALGMGFTGWTIEDITGDGVEDLVVAACKPDGSYWPDGSSIWDGKLTPNMGPGRGYDIQGTWLGRPTTTELYWSRGQRDQSGNLRFAGVKKVFYRHEGFGVQWVSYESGRAIGVIDVQGRKYLLHTGSVDQILALPVRMAGDDMYGDEAIRVVPDDKLLYTYFVTGISVSDLDGDGHDEIVLDGNPGRISVLRGTVMGQFKEEPLLMRGGFVSVDTLAVPCRIDWDGDGLQDLIVGDSSGYMTFWPGTRDPETYGSVVYMKAGGEMIHQQAGPSGSLQGINEKRWGYLNPVVADWDSDGELEIITNNINSQIMLFERTADPHDLALPRPFTANGSPLVAAWRVRPAVVRGSYGVAGDSSCLLYLDWDGDLVLGIPAVRGGAGIAQVRKLRYQSGEAVHLCGPEGLWGRVKMAVADWDEDGKWDILFGTNGSAQKYFIDEAPKEAMPFWLRNTGTNSQPRFDKPRMIKLAGGEVLSFHVHCASVWPTDLDGDGHQDLIVGAEDGKIYRFMRSDLQW